MAKQTTKEAKQELADAMREALKTLAGEAVDAKHLVAVDAENAAKLLVNQNAKEGNDHDLLIKLDTKVDQIQTDITELKKDKDIYITLSDHQELVKVSTDHETRIKVLEICSIDKPKQEIFENKITKIEKVSSNLWIYLTLYGVALGALYVLMTVHIFQTVVK